MDSMSAIQSLLIHPQIIEAACLAIHECRLRVEREKQKSKLTRAAKTARHNLSNFYE